MTYRTGLSAGLPDDDGLEPRQWLARVMLELDRAPLGESAPCMNPECLRPVDFFGGTNLEGRRFCSKRCKDQTGEYRRRARQQIDALERLLAATKGKHGVPRDELKARARQARWWLERLDPTER